MIRVDVSQIQTDLPRYLDEVARGETVVVCKDQEPIAEIRPVAKPFKGPRPLGLAKGMGEILPSFFDPLPDDILDAVEGKGS